VREAPTGNGAGKDRPRYNILFATVPRLEKLR
jgi:hypothetical protein